MSTEEPLDLPIVVSVTVYSKSHMLVKTAEREKSFLVGRLRSQQEHKQVEYPVVFHFLAYWNNLQKANYSPEEQEGPSWDFGASCKNCPHPCLHNEHEPLAIEIVQTVIDKQYMSNLRGGLGFLEKHVAPRISQLDLGDIVIELHLPLLEPRCQFSTQLVEACCKLNRASDTYNRITDSVLGRNVVINQRLSKFGSRTTFRVSYAVLLTRRYLRHAFLKTLQDKLAKRQLYSASRRRRILLVDNFHSGIPVEDARAAMTSLSADDVKSVDYIFLVGDGQVDQLFPIPSVSD